MILAQLKKIGISIAFLNYRYETFPKTSLPDYLNILASGF
jgi:hypothetical protein